MPGHSGAALAAYPEFGCTGRPFDLDQGATTMGIYCAGNDATYEFIEGILSEVIDLFPGKYIHIGGDEVRKDQWKACPKCQARIRREGLKDENQLQSYFIRRIEKFLNARNRTPDRLGRDSRGRAGAQRDGDELAGHRGGHRRGQRRPRRGHDPHLPLLFRLSTRPPAGEPKAIGGLLPLKTVYAFEPVPPALAADKAKHILGGGGNLWSEFFPNYAHVQYMAYPRACAMAEVTWSDPKQTNWDDFSRRLELHLQRLKAEGVNYRAPSSARFARLPKTIRPTDH